MPYYPQYNKKSEINDNNNKIIQNLINRIEKLKEQLKISNESRSDNQNATIIERKPEMNLEKRLDSLEKENEAIKTKKTIKRKNIDFLKKLKQQELIIIGLQETIKLNQNAAAIQTISTRSQDKNVSENFIFSQAAKTSNHIISYIIYGFKANNNYLKQLILFNEIVFICEHWLAQEGDYNLHECITEDQQILFKRSFSLAEKNFFNKKKADLSGGLLG